MSINKNIVLIGMPGAGKSTLGVLLAKAMGMFFVDTDILIQQKENRLLQEIIDTDGIDEFLKIEETVLCETNFNNAVIATGGSAVYSKKAMEHLKKNAVVVYLHVELDEIKKRVTNITTRGIVLKSGKNLADAFEERFPLYEKYADISVNCTDSVIEDSLKKIINSF